MIFRFVFDFAREMNDDAADYEFELMRNDVNVNASNVVVINDDRVTRIARVEFDATPNDAFAIARDTNTRGIRRA